MEDALELMNQVDTLRKKSENHLSSSPSSAAATSLSKQKDQEKISFLKQTGLLKVARDEKELERFIRISNEWKGLELQIYDNKDDQVTKKKNGSLLQSLPLASQGAGLMYCPHGYAVNSPYYLSCLASACEKLAEKEASKASFNVITGVVDSIQSLEDEETYSGVSESKEACSLLKATLIHICQMYSLTLSSSSSSSSSSDASSIDHTVCRGSSRYN